MNNLKTILLLGGLSGMLLLAGELLGGQQGLVIALMLAAGMNLFSYFFSEKMALASSGAIAVTDRENPHIWRRIAPMTQRLCQRMKIPMPKLWLIPEASPNAFATGRDPQHSSVAVSAGLLDLMNDDEVEAVIAHELGHILNRDILISSIAATIAAAITFAARMLMFSGHSNSDDDEGVNPIGAFALMLLAPLAAFLVQMAISRTREYGADAAAARYTGSTQGMISALTKLEHWSRRIPMDANPAMSHMYIFPVGAADWVGRLFSTHPSTAERVQSLRALRMTN